MKRGHEISEKEKRPIASRSVSNYELYKANAYRLSLHRTKSDTGDSDNIAGDVLDRDMAPKVAINPFRER